MTSQHQGHPAEHHRGGDARVAHLTFIAGYFGLLGIGLLRAIGAIGIESEFFSSPLGGP